MIISALIKKEFLQIIRDPSSIFIAFLLPLILLFIFGYGVSLDNSRIKVGLIVEDMSLKANSLSDKYINSNSLEVIVTKDRKQCEELLVGGHIRGIIIIPQDFSKKLASQTQGANIQLITDGSEPNIASFVTSYIRGITQIWSLSNAQDQGMLKYSNAISVSSQFWYNPGLKSKNFLIPGSIAIIMALIGTLLTSLVIAREWERGTMEALLATPVNILQILVGKLVPYFILGICSMLVCFFVATLWYDIPFRGSFLALLLVSSVFLISALAQGLLISSAAKDQFVASQVALISAFLPALMLSGFIFEISSMPKPIEALTYVFSAKYFVTSLHSLFLAGNIWVLLIKSVIAMLVVSFVFFILIARKTVKRLDI
jgi:ABC-2 type transport system permease protein